MNRPEEEAHGPSDETLLTEFLSGREDRFDRLVDRYSKELFAFVARFVGSSAVAEDVVQETFIQVYQSAAGFDKTRKLRPWIFTIAANKARDSLRTRLRRKEVTLGVSKPDDESPNISYLDFLTDGSPSSSAGMEAQEERELVRSIVAELPDHLREILVLGYYQRLPYKEIAEILDIPLGTVKSRLHGAVAQFSAAYKKAIEGQK